MVFCSQTANDISLMRFSVISKALRLRQRPGRPNAQNATWQGKRYDLFHGRGGTTNPTPSEKKSNGENLETGCAWPTIEVPGSAVRCPRNKSAGPIEFWLIHQRGTQHQASFSTCGSCSPFGTVQQTRRRLT